MNLRSAIESEIALTLALSHQNARGNFTFGSTKRLFVHPCPLAARKRRVPFRELRGKEKMSK
jgi:hypothetical protein